MSKFLKIILILCTVFLAATLIFLPVQCMNAAKDAITLCLNIVIPSLFPFFICSGLLVGLGLAYACSRYLSPIMRPTFNVPGAGAIAFILGIVSGYPVGAKCALDLYSSGQCTKAEAERLLSFCNNSGPLFILGAVGVGMFNNPQIGRYLYISHIISAILVGLCFKLYRSPKSNSAIALPPSKTAFSNIGAVIGETVSSSVNIILKVCGFVIVFSVFAAALPTFSATPYLYGLLEITGGINSFVSQNINPTLKASMISFFLAFSGISVLFQVSSIISPGGLSIKPYIIGKTLQGVFSFIVTYFIFSVFPITINTFKSFHGLNFTQYRPSRFVSTSLSLIFWSIISILILIFILWISENKPKK